MPAPGVDFMTLKSPLPPPLSLAVASAGVHAARPCHSAASPCHTACAPARAFRTGLELHHTIGHRCRPFGAVA
jgi:hypothetical protein